MVVLHRNPRRFQRGNRHGHRVQTRAALCREPFGRTIHRIKVIVAIVKEIAHLFPRAGLYAGVFATQSFIKRSKTFVGLAIGAVQVQKRAGKGRGV